MERWKKILITVFCSLIISWFITELILCDGYTYTWYEYIYEDVYTYTGGHRQELTQVIEHTVTMWRYLIPCIVKSVLTTTLIVTTWIKKIKINKIINTILCSLVLAVSVINIIMVRYLIYDIPTLFTLTSMIMFIVLVWVKSKHNELTDLKMQKRALKKAYKVAKLQAQLKEMQETIDSINKENK